MIHFCHPALLGEFNVALIGAGGSGSQMLTCLARLRHAMVALGHPGFDVDVWDPDTVSTANVGRQMFAPADVGLSKAAVLVHRVNAWFGTGWRSHAQRYRSTAVVPAPDLVIVCVDSTRARAEIREHFDGYGRRYVLDLGNRADDGQVVLGQVGPSPRRPQLRATRVPPEHVDLPDPYRLLPELVDVSAPADDAPSCSVAEALERQALFVNDDVTRAAALILWNLLRHGRISWHGVFVNGATGRRTPLPVDPQVWERMQGGPRGRAGRKERREVTA